MELITSTCRADDSTSGLLTQSSWCCPTCSVALNPLRELPAKVCFSGRARSCSPLLIELTSKCFQGTVSTDLVCWRLPGTLYRVWHENSEVQRLVGFCCGTNSTAGPGVSVCVLKVKGPAGYMYHCMCEHARVWTPR